MSKPIHILLASLLISAAVQAAPAPDATTAQPAPAQNVTGTQDGAAKGKLSDTDFVRMGLQSGLTTVELAKLVMKKSRTVGLRQLAPQIIATQEAGNRALKQLAEQNRVAAPAALDQDHKNELQQLQDQAAVAFEQQILARLVKDYDTLVGLFDNAAGEMDMNAALRRFAGERLPELRKQQEQLHKLAPDVEQR